MAVLFMIKFTTILSGKEDSIAEEVKSCWLPALSRSQRSENPRTARLDLVRANVGFGSQFISDITPAMIYAGAADRRLSITACRGWNYECSDGRGWGCFFRETAAHRPQAQFCPLHVSLSLLPVPNFPSSHLTHPNALALAPRVAFRTGPVRCNRE